MANTPRSELVTMTQDAPGTGPRGAASPDEIAFGHSKRKQCGTPARMRQVARTLLELESRAHEAAGWKPTAAELERAQVAGAMLQREADRWDAEGLIDCT
jgi:hypothetical protein